jgi:hypothetical protein
VNFAIAEAVAEHGGENWEIGDEQAEDDVGPTHRRQ